MHLRRKVSQNQSDRALAHADLAGPGLPSDLRASQGRTHGTYVQLYPADLERRIAVCQARLVEINRSKRDQKQEVRRPGHSSAAGSSPGRRFRGHPW